MKKYWPARSMNDAVSLNLVGKSEYLPWNNVEAISMRTNAAANTMSLMNTGMALLKFLVDAKVTIFFNSNMTHPTNSSE